MRTDFSPLEWIFLIGLIAGALTKLLRIIEIIKGAIERQEQEEQEGE